MQNMRRKQYLNKFAYDNCLSTTVKLELALAHIENQMCSVHKGYVNQNLFTGSLNAVGSNILTTVILCPLRVLISVSYYDLDTEFREI